MNIPNIIKQIQRIDTDNEFILSLKEHMLHNLCHDVNKAIAQITNFNRYLKLNGIEMIDTE